jgi:hypothetical protein
MRSCVLSVYCGCQEYHPSGFGTLADLIREDGFDSAFRSLVGVTLWSWSLVVFVLFFVTVYTVFAYCTFMELPALNCLVFLTENATSSAVYG